MYLKDYILLGEELFQKFYWKKDTTPGHPLYSIPVCNI